MQMLCNEGCFQVPLTAQLIVMHQGECDQGCDLIDLISQFAD